MVVESNDDMNTDNLLKYAGLIESYNHCVTKLT